MLYDPKWQRKRVQDLTRDDFIAWLETKDPAEEYEWMNVCGCVVGQYLTARTGSTRPGALVVYSELFGGGWGYVEICSECPHTFGAALKRARQRC